MKSNNIPLESLKEKKISKVFTKIPKKALITFPLNPPLFECELIKKGKITKNKRYFKFYSDFILFYAVKTK